VCIIEEEASEHEKEAFKTGKSIEELYNSETIQQIKDDSRKPKSMSGFTDRMLSSSV
jgi:hypothetical protein